MFGSPIPLGSYLEYNGGEVLAATIACAVGGLLAGVMISALIRHSATSPPPRVAAPPRAPTPDRVEKLRQLKELLDSGALNEQEFAAEKARILGQSS
ncbi:MAG: hypothetical protein BGP24_07905 [Lysobacterales bacterium 69-70]|nr:MAG: hypothetical protein ABS97_08565 [Xanthomonadaceae bacterium SCN 69-320]ODV19441.1 MAG: hypothetical protein ABT27_10360 [Xanthomonadaceae bacterium SCN 69-25]OJY94651.1 MAG: hypothetical protein BGP24_07905 [Xanthomonadales bacterium 69-70]